jgi:hypothetical protein
MDVDQITREEYLAIPADERPHLYPGREPSNATYTGSKNRPGCRCVSCQAEHARAIRKNRQVIQVEPESVVDMPIPPEPQSGVASDMAASESELAAASLSAATEPSVHPQPVEPVYSEPSSMPTAEEIAADVLKLAVRVAEASGALPGWMLSASQIAARYGVPLNVAKQATRDNREYIGVSRYLNGGRGGAALIKKPLGIWGTA